MAEMSIGSVLAGYRIEGVAGEGGMGRVYRATQIGLNRKVALKLIMPELASRADFRARFQRESHLSASIDHPNVIPVYEAGEAEGRLFIAMRWVEGTDLRSVIASEGKLEPGRAVAIVEQVAAALDAAHRAGLVHRDVKPANVMLTSTHGQEHVYLTDFGLTKRTTQATALTRTGAFVGTPDYMPPEQIKGERADARADVYALGCLLFHALTGRPPYDRDTEVAKMFAQLHDPPPSAVEAVPGTPAGLDAVIARALAKDPDERYPSAGDLGRAARAALADAAPSQPERSLATGLAAPQATEIAPTAASPQPTAASPPPTAASPPRTAPPATPSAPPTTPSEPPGTPGPPPTTPSETPGTPGPPPTTPSETPGTPGPPPTTPSETPGTPGPPPTTPSERPAPPPTAAATASGGEPPAATPGAPSEPTGPPTPPPTAAAPGAAARAPAEARSPAVPPGAPRERPRRRALPIALAVLVGGVAAVLVLTGVFSGDEGSTTSRDAAGGSPPKPAPPRVVATIPAGNGPDGIAVDGSTVWVSNSRANTLTRLGTETDKPIGEPIQVGANPDEVEAADGVVWVANTDDGTVTRLEADPEPGTPAPIQVGAGPEGLSLGKLLWVANGDSDSVSRIDPGSATPVEPAIAVQNKPIGIVAGRNFVWVTNSFSGSVSRIDPSSGQVVGTTTGVGKNIRSVIEAFGFVWVSSAVDNGTVVRLDPRTGDVVGRPIQVGDRPKEMAAAGGYLWLVNERSNNVMRIDPKRAKVVGDPIQVGRLPVGIAAGAGSLWVSNNRSNNVTRIDPGGG